MDSNSIKKSRGRPRKFTQEEAAASKRNSNRYAQQRRRHPRIAAGPSDFIAYEPPLSDVPVNTPPSGLRLSPDIPIPLDDDSSIENPSNIQSNPPLSTSSPIELTTELEEQMRHIRLEEEEADKERVEYETAISEKMKETSLAIDSNETVIQSVNTINTIQETRVGDPSEDRTLDNDSTPVSNSRHPSVSIQGSVDNPILLSSPIQSRSPSFQLFNQSRSQQSSSTGRNRFSVQSNLEAWLTPSLHPTSRIQNTTPTPSLPQHTTNTSSSSHSPIESVPSSTPSESVIPSTPAFINPEFAPSSASTGSPSPAPSAPSTPIKRTALKLAKQLRNFQGCTHEQHETAEQLHREHHQEPDIHSECSSLQDITTLLKGDYPGGVPLPDVLSNHKLLQAGDYNFQDFQAAFEGVSTTAAPEDDGTRNENLPKNLCLSQHHLTSKKNREAKVTYDIDSICCFPTSLGFAKRGIHWLPKAHSILNLTADIHFALKIPTYNNRGILIERATPLHKIPHYCFGNAIGMESLLIFIFFPALHLESNYQHTSYLSNEDNELFFDAIVSPALNRVIQSSNIIQHYPASARISQLDAMAISTEGLRRKESSREQLVKHTIQPQYLDRLWDAIVQSIEDNPGFHRFRGATLFAHSKNIKLEFMNASLTKVYDDWHSKWVATTDTQFYNPDRTFVDLAKQVTSQDTALPFDHILTHHEAEVFLWKKCCLEAYAKSRVVLEADGSPARGNPRRTVYPWATMRDTIGQTLFAVPHGQENMDGLIYSQFYGLIKTPFDSSKVYVFDNDSVENLALDPGYIRALQQAGGGITFSKAVAEFGYQHSKKRAHANLVDNRAKSYGIREEHRISQTMMEEIYQQWQQWDQYDDEHNINRPHLPYYIIPTKGALDFLAAQINKYCFLFEHILSHTGKTYSLPETTVMITALRALRFSYGSNLLQQESLLYKDRWEHMRDSRLIVKEGLGMQDTMERCGLGWFLPKFNWATCRLAPPHGDNILVGSALVHKEYKRRWRAVKDLRDVYIRFNQAASWYDRYNMSRNSVLYHKWLNYLFALNLEQFNTDIWKEMLKSHKHSPELSPLAFQSQGNLRFCYTGMKRLFQVDGVVTPPHFVTGNKMRYNKVNELLDFLFSWGDNKERRGWTHKPYRIILQRTFELIERRRPGDGEAESWLKEFLYLVRLTHWVLPYPTHLNLIASTKTNHHAGLKRRMMWFSSVYANPEKVELPLRVHPQTLHDILWRASRVKFGSDRDNLWEANDLILACDRQGIDLYESKKSSQFWVVGKHSIGSKGYVPRWERGAPPRLKMMEDIHQKSLDELEELMAALRVKYAHCDIRDDEGDNSFDDDSELDIDDDDNDNDNEIATFLCKYDGDRARNSTGSVFTPSSSVL
ncbi:hypothetical protein H4I96_00003 [Botrytis cinerea]